MNKTFLRASLIAMFGVVACGNDFMNVMASDEVKGVSADVIFDPGAENEEAVKSIVAEMQNYIRSSYSDYYYAAKLMSNYVYAKGGSLEALFPSVLKDLRLGDPVDNKAKLHVEELFRSLGYLSLKTWFGDIEPDELLAIATDNLNDYQKMVRNDMDYYTALSADENYEFTKQRALAAALAGSVEVFKFMDGNSWPIYDSDLFTAALVGGNQELVHLCVQKGADKTWRFNCFEGKGFINENLVVWLIKQGKKIDKEVANRFLVPVIVGGELNFVKYLVEECHADVEAKDGYGNTPLILASQNGYLDIVKSLVEQGQANVEAKSRSGYTPLIFASQKGYLDIVKYLVEECHADVEAKDGYGNTPLILASQNGYLDIVKSLVEQGNANVEAKNNDGFTPLILASLGGHLDVVKYLVEKCHADVEAKNKDCDTPLILASQRGDLGIIKYLVEKCKADVEAKNNNGFTPLILASLFRHLDVVKYLVEECHADVEAKDRSGNTPLSWASQWMLLDVVKYLVEQGHAKITDKAISKAETDEIRNYLKTKKDAK